MTGNSSFVLRNSHPHGTMPEVRWKHMHVLAEPPTHTVAISPVASLSPPHNSTVELLGRTDAHVSVRHYLYLDGDSSIYRRRFMPRYTHFSGEDTGIGLTYSCMM